MLAVMTPQKKLNFSLFPPDDPINRTLEDPPMELESYILTAFVLFFIGLFGFFLNLIGIILMVKDKELRTPINTILLNLLCSDFSVSVFGNPQALISAIYQHWIFGRELCVIYGFFMTLLGMNSITTLAVLSFERYLMISQPIRRHHLSHREAKWAIVVIWMYAFSLAGPPFFGWGDYVSEAADISCSVNWEQNDFNTTTYIVFLFTFGLVAPVLVISFSYLNIVYTLRKNTLTSSRTAKAEIKVALMVGVMIVAFLIAWLPYAVLSLIVAFGDSSNITPALAVVPALVAKSSICYNPIIYAGYNAQFQAAWKRVFGVNDTAATRTGGCELTTLTHSIKLQNVNVTSLAPKLRTAISSDGSAKLKINVVTQMTDNIEVEEEYPSQVV